VILKFQSKYYDNGVLMVAMVKAGVELAFEAMTDLGL
jgi:ketol-acid reductoisomerase